MLKRPKTSTTFKTFKTAKPQYDPNWLKKWQKHQKEQLLLASSATAQGDESKNETGSDSKNVGEKKGTE